MEDSVERIVLFGRVTSNCGDLEVVGRMQKTNLYHERDGREGNARESKLRRARLQHDEMGVHQEGSLLEGNLDETEHLGRVRVEAMASVQTW